MAQIVTNDANYYAIASAIREKLGTDNLFKPREMAPAIQQISYYQKSVSILDLSTSTNGTYRPPHVGYAFENITVDVDTTVPLCSLSVSRNGEYFPSVGWLFSYINVDIPIEQLSESLIWVYSNGTYYPPDGYAYTNVAVDMPSYEFLSIELRRNGYYQVPSVSGHNYLYWSVTVNVPEIDRVDFYSVFNRESQTVINSEITKLRDCAFYRNGTVREVDFPNVTTIGTNAFFSCTSLRVVNIPKVGIIQVGGFLSCSYLSTLTLQACSVISSRAFENCYRLTSLYLLSTSVVTIQNFKSVFKNSPISDYAPYTSLGKLYVPSTLLSMYKTHSQWGLISSRIYSYTS